LVGGVLVGHSRNVFLDFLLFRHEGVGSSDSMSELHTAARRAIEPAPGLLEQVASVPFRTADSLSSAGEEFRMLSTRLNHIQGLKGIQTITVSSPATGEGKSFVAANLALAEAQLKDNLTLLCDFDFRHATLHELFGVERMPGLTDYLQNRAELHQAMRRIGDTNLYVMPAGSQVVNPLELLTLKKVKQTLDQLAGTFSWVILDSPPLLSAADGNLLSTLSDGTLLVVRMGATSLKSIPLAIQSLCHNNVLGVVVNGSRV
jgi:capsular exopolysaccharide synthesis family protein